MDNRQYVAGKRYQLAGSGCTSAASSITVNNLFLPDPAGTSITMAMFGAVGYATLEPVTSKVEFISFTGITDNGDKSFTLTGVTRGLDFKAPYTNVPANQIAHSGGSILIFSNSPQVYDNFANKNNDETIVQTWTFTNPNVPRMDGSHAYIAGEEEFFATKRYVDGVVTVGAPDASTTQKGIVQEATAAQIDAGTAAGSTAARLFMNPAQWQAGSTYALIPTQGQKNALPGDDTSITLGTGNKFVTQTGLQNQAEISGTSTGNSSTALGNFTVTINSPGVFTLNNHNLIVGDTVVLSTTGALPTGLSAATTYYVISAGLTTNNFELSATRGGSAINTTGSQSGVHSITLTTSNYLMTPVPQPTVYASGQEFNIIANFDNSFVTGAILTTVQIGTLGRVVLLKNATQNLAPGDIKNGQVFKIKYDGTNFQLLSPTAQGLLGLFNNGIATYDMSTSSGGQNIAHGLSVTPKFIRLSASWVVNAANAPSTGIGVYNGTTTSGIYFTTVNSGLAGESSTNILTLSSNSGNSQVATVTVDGTNIILSWTKAGSPTGTAQIMFEAFA